MTINRALEQIETTHPSQYDRNTLIGWLSDLDKKAYEMQLNHEGEWALNFGGYTESTSGDTEMLIESPYDEIYPTYLDMKISLSDRDYAFYNNAAVLFETAWQNYTAHINRTHRPVAKTRIFNFKGDRHVHTSE